MKKQLLLALFAVPVIANAQFFENFEGSAVMPVGWTALNGGDVNTWEIIDYTGSNINAYSGSQTVSIGFDTDPHDDYLVTPAITVTAGVSDYLSFYARSRDPFFPETMSVKVSTTAATASGFTNTLAASVAPASGADFYKYTYDLSAYAGQTIYIGFHSETTDMFYFDIDDVFVGTAPTCDVPSNIMLNGSSSDSAYISWTASPTAGASYQIEYGPAGFVQGTGTVISSGTTSATIPSLSPSTAYQFYVRANCGTNGFSLWSAAIPFSTSCVALANFPYAENFDNETIPDCWRNEAVSGGGTAVWNYVLENQNGTITPKSAPRMAEFRTTSSGNMANLVMVPLDLSALASPELHFSLANTNWLGDVDELRIYYKSNAGDAWTPIGSTYTTEHTSWLNVSIPLPDKSSHYQIAFQGTSNFARGMDVDDVTVMDASAPLAVDTTEKADHTIKIYPNPAKDRVFIKENGNIRSIEIFSLTGRLIKTLDKSSKSIDISDMMKGVYLIRIKSEGTDQSFKLIKE